MTIMSKQMVYNIGCKQGDQNKFDQKCVVAFFEYTTLLEFNRGKYFRLLANMHCGIVSNFIRFGEKF